MKLPTNEVDLRRQLRQLESGHPRIDYLTRVAMAAPVPPRLRSLACDELGRIESGDTRDSVGVQLSARASLARIERTAVAARGTGVKANACGVHAEERGRCRS